MGKIYSEIRSGLGNQLFQFAFGYAMACEFDKELLLCPAHFDSGWKYSLKKMLGQEARSFRLPAIIKKSFNVVNPKVLKGRLAQDGIIVVKEKEVDIQQIRSILSAKKGDVYLQGYWQNPGFFSAFKEPLVQLIEPSFVFSKTCRKILNMMDETFVGVHVRRGDFLTNRSFGACSVDYYNQAIECVASVIKNPRFVVFTNDKEWVSKHFRKDFPYEVYIGSDKNTDIEELYLMTKFKSLVISNSTFSWWSAYLNTTPTKYIISPSRWFLKSELQANVHNFISKEWIVLNNQLERKN
jgi:hypothetical protein